MSENRHVNALDEALANAPNGHRVSEAVSKLLGRCQKCTEWDRGCTQFAREEWIRLLITEGEKCDRMSEPALDKLTN